MFHFSPSFATLTVALSAIFLQASKAADPPPKPTSKAPPASIGPDKELFLLYVLEDFFRDTAIAADKLPSEPRRLKDFLQIRRTQVDRLLSYVERTSAINPSYREAFVGYRGLLTSPKIDELQSKLNARQEIYDAGIRAIYVAVDKEMADRRSDAIDDVGRTVIEAGLRAPYLSDEKRYRYMRVMGAVASVFQKVKLEDARAKLMADASAQEKVYRDQNYPSLKDDLDKINAEFADVFAATRRTSIAKASELMKGIAASKNWSSEEATFDPIRNPSDIDPQSRPRDPFLAAWRGRMMDRPEAKNKEQIEAVHKVAKDCLAAEKLVPDGPQFTSFHSRLALQAGYLANLAAAADTADAEFTHSPGRGKADSPAFTAVRAWRKYAEMEKPDLTKRGFVVHQTVTAFVNAGLTVEAHQKLDEYLRSAQRAKALSAISDPEMVLV